MHFMCHVLELEKYTALDKDCCRIMCGNGARCPSVAAGWDGEGAPALGEGEREGGDDDDGKGHQRRVPADLQVHRLGDGGAP